MIQTRAGDVQGELHLLTYLQTAAGARFTAISYWRPDQVPQRRRPSPGTPAPGAVHAGQLTAVNDQGTGYQFGVSVGPHRTEWSGVLDLHPTPPQGSAGLTSARPPASPRRASS